MEDTSLDRFLDADAESDGPASGDGAGEEPASGAEADEESASGVEAGEASASDTGEGESPDPPTSRCVREARECAACGRAVGRLWRDDGRMVCPECKDWA